MKASMSKEEYEKLLKEMEDLMGKPKEEEQPEDTANRDEHFFDPEEQKKYEEYNKNKKLAE